MPIEDEIIIGADAQQVIDSEAFQCAFATLESELTTKWQTSRENDAAGREKCYQLLFLAKAMRANLESLILTGKLAVEKRTRLQMAADRAKSFFE